MRERLSRVGRRPSEDTELSGVPERPLRTSDRQGRIMGLARPSGAGLLSLPFLWQRYRRAMGGCCLLALVRRGSAHGTTEEE